MITIVNDGSLNHPTCITSHTSRTLKAIVWICCHCNFVHNGFFASTAATWIPRGPTCCASGYTGGPRPFIWSKIYSRKLWCFHWSRCCVHGTIAGSKYLYCITMEPILYGNYFWYMICISTCITHVFRHLLVHRMDLEVVCTRHLPRRIRRCRSTLCCIWKVAAGAMMQVLV